MLRISSINQLKCAMLETVILQNFTKMIDEGKSFKEEVIDAKPTKGF